MGGARKTTPLPIFCIAISYSARKAVKGLLVETIDPMEHVA
jgi:hypothetical protein